MPLNENSADFETISGPQLGTGPDQIGLLLGQDEYDGDVQFTVSVDGVQVGGVQTVTAIQADNTDELFTLHGNWGAGSTVAVDFLNDAWDGMTGNGNDRNLYVDGVTYNGVTVSDAVTETNWNGPSYYSTQATVRANDFVQGLGVTTHVLYYDTSYKNEPLVLSELQYLGFDHVRDGGADADPASLQRFEYLMSAGIKFDFDSAFSAGLGVDVSNMETLLAACPGSIVSTEGINEVNNSFSYDGLTGEDAANLYQQQLYQAIRSDPKLADVAVLNYTTSVIYDPSVFTRYGDISSEADYGNVHLYGFGGMSNYVDTLLPRMLEGTPNSKGFVVTETGYDTMSNGDDVSAKYLLDDVLDLKQAGASMTYLYELMDENADPGLTDTEDHYGLFNSDGTPKESAVAFHNLTTILADRGADAATFTPGVLPYALSGLPADGNSMMFEKSDGTFDLAVWAEPQLLASPGSTVEIAAPVNAVTVTLAAKTALVEVFDPMLGSTPIATYADVSSVVLDITDHPLIVEIDPGTGSGSGSGSAAASASTPATEAADVFVGGDAGFDTLGTASASATLRATGRVGLYEDQPGVQAASAEGVLPAIQSAFAGTGPGFAELPYKTSGAANWFSSAYPTLYTGPVSEAAVDVNSYTIDPVAWTAFVAAAQDAGITRVAPVFAPDAGAGPSGDFATLPDYASLRAAAVAGGGIALSTSPDAALALGPSYLAFEASAIGWAESAGVKSTVILSPDGNDLDAHFLEDTVSIVAQLAAADALPDAWAVTTGPADGAAAVGSESDPESVAGVAQFLASSNDTAASVAAGPASFDWTTALHLTVGGTRQVSVSDTGGEAYVVGGSGGVVMSSSGAGDQVWTLAGSANTIQVGASAVVNSAGNDVLSVGNGSVVNIAGAATISGSTGSSSYDVTGSADIASQATGTGDVIQAYAGSTLDLQASGSGFMVTDNGAAALRVGETAGTDDNVADVVGHGMVYGGAGRGLIVNTAAGMATQVTLDAGSTTVYSQGTADDIVGSSGSSTIVVAGTASITSQSASGDTVIANTGSTADVSVTSDYATLLENAATLNVSETGGGGDSAFTVSGGNAAVYGGAGPGLAVNTAAGVATRVTLGRGNYNILSRGNGDVITGDAGASTVNILGNATVTSQSALGDVIIANTGSTADVSVTSDYATLLENAATLNVTETGGGGNSALTVSGGNAMVYGNAGAGVAVYTAAGVATHVALGRGNFNILSQGNGDVVTGDAGASVINILGTATVTSQSATSDTIIANTGSTANVSVTGAYATLLENAATLNVSETGGGGNSALTVSGGNAIVYGGAGTGLGVNTAAGVATRVTLGTGNFSVLSQGNGDVITGDAGASVINILGTASVTSQSTIGDTVIANTGSIANVSVTSRYATLLENAATLNVSETGGGGNSALTVSGGNAIVYGGAGTGLNVQTAAGVNTTVRLGTGNANVVSLGNDTIQAGVGSETISGGSGKMNFVAGAGAATVIGGSGAMTVTAGSGNMRLVGSNAGDTFQSGGGTATFTEGSGNNLAVLGLGSADVIGGSGTNTYSFEAGTGTRFQEVQNYHVGRDAVSYQGFGGGAVASQSVSNGSLTLTLTDGDVVRFDGVTRLS